MRPDRRLIGAVRGQAIGGWGMLDGDEARLAIGRRKAPVLVEADLAFDRTFRIRPLLRAGVIEQGIAEAGDIEVAAARAFAMLVEDGLGIAVREQGVGTGMIELATEATGEIDDDLPVVARLAGWRNRRLDTGDATLGIGHRAVLLAPAAGRQQEIGVVRGVGVGVGLLEHDILGRPQRFAYCCLIGQRLRRIGAGDPDRLDLAGFKAFEQVDRSLARLCRYEGHAPETCHLGAVGRVAEVAMRRQQVGQAADFAPAHRVGLPGQREGTSPRLADLPGRQVQMDDAGVVVRAMHRLVESLAIQRQGRPTAGEPARRLDDIRRVHTADFGGDGWWILRGDFGQRREAGRVGSHVGFIDQFFGDQHVEHTVEQGDVGARSQRQMEIGNLGAFRAARVGDDDLQVGIGGAGVLDVAEDDRVGDGRIGASNEDELGLQDVRVAARRGIGAQCLLVAGNGRRHAEPRIGVDVVGADQALGQFVEDVVILGHQLAGNVEGDRIRAVGTDDLGEPAGRVIERRIPTQRFSRPVPHGCAVPGAGGGRPGQRSGRGSRPWCTGARGWRGGRGPRARR